MSDSIFLDTNILVYAYSDTELQKQTIARKLVSENISFISTQVLQELSNTLSRKFKKSWLEITEAVKEVSLSNLVHANNEATIQQAIKIAEQYKFSFYDSLIIASALECKCAKLYSEDMSHGQLIEKQITIINPFASL
ncbi:MAG: PIN domain-containing protein [Cyclobacteriaceae bacterium]|nr:PIN domain-containing protein [Cyclobacteriaceae bacterium]